MGRNDGMQASMTDHGHFVWKCLSEHWISKLWTNITHNDMYRVEKPTPTSSIT